MLDLLSQFAPSEPALGRALDDHVRTVAAGPRGDTSVVSRIEAEVSRAPLDHIAFDATGMATLAAAGRHFRAGRFETRSLGALRQSAAERRARAGGSSGTISFWVLDGASPATDIGALQAHAPPGALFQVASQFNCLEAPDAFVAPIADYLSDPTQGPRASISAFPGTFVRHYAAPAADGTRYVQSTDGAQVDLLADVSVGARVTNGYLLASNIVDPAAFARALTERHDEVRVGVHDGVEVVFGHNWSGPVPDAPDLTIAQVLTSSVAAGGYSRLSAAGEHTDIIVRQLQRAAHLGTLLAAAALGKTHVCSTLIGGGVFGNPHAAIFDAVLWAIDAAKPYVHRDLTLVLNGYNLGNYLPRQKLREATASRGGALVAFDADGVRIE